MAETETPTTSATTTPTATGDDLQLEQQVEITDKGPCLKHIKVTVPREIINRLLDQKLGELGRTVPVPGFRPGKAPAQLVRRYLEPQALEEIRPTLLLASLQQILEQHNLNPITTPNFDPLAVSIPKEGPLVYEFDLEVWPDFPLPTYKGMKLKRPVFQITDEILRNEREIFIRRRAGRLVKKEAAEPGDVIVGTLSVYRDGRKVGDFEVNLRVSDEVRFHDGVVRNFIPIIAGAKPKEERSFTIELFRSNRPQEITGTAQGTLLIKEIYTVQVPESLEEILQEVGCDSEEELMERVREALQARIDSTQREWLRSQIVTAWLQEVQPQLPASVLAQEYRRALSRRILELQRARLHSRRNSTLADRHRPTNHRRSGRRPLLPDDRSENRRHRKDRGRSRRGGQGSGVAGPGGARVAASCSSTPGAGRRTRKPRGPASAKQGARFHHSACRNRRRVRGI
jgi:trigger factor